jgi:hypothetical protein
MLLTGFSMRKKGAIANDVQRSRTRTGRVYYRAKSDGVK